MFKARGTKIIIEDGDLAGPVIMPAATGFVMDDTVIIADIPHVVTDIVVPDDHVPDHVENDDFGLDLDENTPLGNFGVGPAMHELPAVRQHNAERAADLADAMGMGMPTLPPDFATLAARARAGDLDAIGIMRGIGEQVPVHMRLAFAEMVHGLLEAD